MRAGRADSTTEKPITKTRTVSTITANMTGARFSAPPWCPVPKARESACSNTAPQVDNLLAMHKSAAGAAQLASPGKVLSKSPAHGFGSAGPAQAAKSVYKGLGAWRRGVAKVE